MVQVYRGCLEATFDMLVESKEARSTLPVYALVKVEVDFCV